MQNTAFCQKNRIHSEKSRKNVYYSANWSAQCREVCGVFICATGVDKSPLMFDVIQFGKFSFRLLRENVLCHYTFCFVWVWEWATKKKHGAKKEKIKERQRKFRSNESSKFYSSIEIIKSRKILWAGLLLHMG
jgi:hypothetical protein